MKTIILLFCILISTFASAFTSIRRHNYIKVIENPARYLDPNYDKENSKKNAKMSELLIKNLTTKKHHIASSHPES